MIDLGLIRASFPDALRKLDPRVMVHNPVMFVVEVGSVITTGMFVREPSAVRRMDRGVAVAHGAVREPGRGRRRRARQSPSGSPARRAVRDVARRVRPEGGRSPYRVPRCVRTISSSSRPAR